MLSGISIDLILLYRLVWYSVLPENPDKTIRSIVHIDLGILSLIIVFLMIRDMLFIPSSFIIPQWSDIAFSQYGTYVLIIFSTILLLIGYLRASKVPELLNVKVPIENLPSDINNFLYCRSATFMQAQELMKNMWKNQHLSQRYELK